MKAITMQKNTLANKNLVKMLLFSEWAHLWVYIFPLKREKHTYMEFLNSVRVLKN